MLEYIMTTVFNKYALKTRRKQLRSNMTGAEKVLWDKLKGRQLAGLKFRRQYSINGYIVDFYCPKVKLAIEIDGSIHEQEDAKQYDSYRQQHIEFYDIKFLRFTNKDVFYKLKMILKNIAVVCNSKKLPKNGLPLSKGRI